ncbi:unnamed protein product [Rotaria magnacalcarata]|uniref:Uncharacterized protein n=2 Tax=Rotaria magnacalcarata TaxID=392030 RepID=A0A816V576_9BILA|nr:unnamed protein product [Rotaria magnacalcarata]
MIRPICAPLNYGGINHARDRRGSAQSAVNAAREQLANRQRELERQRLEQVNFGNQKTQVTAQLRNPSLSLSQLETRELTLANIAQQIRKIVQHLGSFVSRSSVLYNELQDLTSFENLVKPLNFIMTKVIENGETTKETAGTTQISSVEVHLTSDTLDLIKSACTFFACEHIRIFDFDLLTMIVRGAMVWIFFVLIIQMLCFAEVMGQYKKQPMATTSLVYEFDLPKDPLINPFYSPAIESLRSSNKQVIKMGRSASVIEVGGTEATHLAQRPTIDSTWENLIASGPTTVNLLAQIMVLSSKLDFSLKLAAPKYSFTYVKYPDSFRVTLGQISNEGWRAFLTAHTNMDQLQLNMQRIPTHVKVALKVLTEEKRPRTLGIQIRKVLNSIKRISSDCINLANNTHMEFANVMNHLGEVIALTEANKGLGESQLRQVEIELNVSRVWQTQLTQLNDIMKEHYKNTEDDLRFAHVEYSKALARRPSRFEKSLMRITGAVIKLINNAVKTFQGLTSGDRQSSSTPIGLNGLTGGNVAPTTERGKSLLMAQSFFESIRNLIKIFNDVFYSNKNQTTSGNPQEMENILYELETYAKLIGKNEIATNVIEPMMERARNWSKAAIQLVKNKGMDRPVTREETDQVLFQLNRLMDETKKIDAAAGLISDPSKVKSNDNNGYSSDATKMMVQITERQLQDARKRSEASRIQLQKNMDDMSDLVGKIALLDLKRVNYAQLLYYMREALVLLGTTRQTWAQLILFFSTIANQVEIALSGTLSPFIKQIEMATNGELSVDERSFFVELLKDQSVNIHETSHSLFIMSRTYVDMSNEFLMPRLAGLSHMFAGKDDDERTALNRQLAAETKVTQDKVKALIEERKIVYATMVETERTKLKIYLNSIGGPAEENQKAIEEASALIASNKLTSSPTI